MPSYKLYYFNSRGSAEPIRLVFAQAGVQYEDIRFTPEQWAEFKPKAPYGVVPVLEIDGKLFGGSLPIARYLAKQFGLAGDDDTAQLILEGTDDAIRDFTAKLVAVFYEKDEARKVELKKDLAENVIPKTLGALNKLAGSNNCIDGWFYGSKVSYVDLYFMHIAEYVKMMDAPDVLDKFPALKKLDENVRKLPNVAKWISERPQTDH